MGVPAFYRWLISRYPKIVLNNIENPPSTTTPGSDQSPPAVDQYDNLYIDMNGLIHPCSHPEDRPPPSSEQEIFDNIALYVDRLFAAIQPSRLLFLSIDGVAPRAKMNQQRARRYRAAQDRQERDKLTSQVISELFPDVSLPETPHIWDSNVITPGTEFMSHLSDFLHRYIEEKMRTEDNWKNIKVILSDASVCGEGEHKIMAFIRSQRTQEGYDPNQHHVVHGLDADLIMLALGTHEPKFSILREEQMSTYEKKKEKRRLSRTQASAADNEDEVPTASADDWVHAQKLLCLRVEYLREYFSSEYDFLRESLGERFDLERIIDDLIFLCYFVGNDFLPHLPTLEIREGGIDLLLSAYKQLMPYWPGYLTGTEVNGERVIYTPQLWDILRKVSENETEVLVSKEVEERKLEEIAAASDDAPLGTFRSTSGHAQQSRKIGKHLGDGSELVEEGAVAEMMQVVKEEVDRRISEIEKHAATEQRRRLRGKVHGDSPKDRYYNNPFRNKDLVEGRGLDRMCQSYLDGLCWVLNYYLQGPPSWEWFYPFHYAPCASDLTAAAATLSASVPHITYRMDFSSPLKPVEQLLSVLPAESAHALPLACQGLMTSPSSPLADVFHPKEISIDRGNAMSWLWILLLPFVDVNRIIKASRECEPHFTAAETARNSSGTVFLYVSSLQCGALSSKPSAASAPAAAAASVASSVSAIQTTEKDDLRDCLSPLSQSTETPESAVVYPLYGFVSHAPVEDSDDEEATEENETAEGEKGVPEEGGRVLCFRYFLPTETIHRSALIAGILPMNSPLDLRIRHKKMRGPRRGGRPRGGGSRGGRGSGGRDGEGRGRGAEHIKHGGHGRR